MKKNIWSGLLGITLIGGLLAGCGSGSGGETQGAAADGKTEVRLYTYGTEEAYNWTGTFAAFEEKHPEIKMTLVQLSPKGDTQEAMKKLDLAAASNEDMDVIMFSDPGSYAQHVGLGMAEPLEPYLEKDGYKVEEDYKIDTHIDGKVYALPGKFNSWYVLLNKTMLDEAGLEVPTDWTWDEFAEYAKKLTQGEGAQKTYGTYFHGPQNGSWTEYMKLMLVNQPDNSDFLKADGTSNLDDPNFKKTLELRWKMEKEDGSATPYETMLSQKLNYRNEFFNEKAAMIITGSWMTTEIGGTDQTPLNFEVAVAPIPKNAEGDEIGYSPVTTDFVSVAASSKHKDEAYTFVRWYTTEGQEAQGKNISSWKQSGDDKLESTIDTILSGTKAPDKVDKQSLVDTLKNSKASKLVPPVTYQSEIYKALSEEFEKFIFGQQDVDQTVNASQERVQKLIDSNS
ncbi:ABC transporter substrate-binding protein [Saccharibacillus kuerlensis]|uniref:Sugar ABC transporter substrate-binding protein n=1 Tax=Saccharibacillus kuerlensis TaxID=459527 RepID=A0ABQ2KTV7_9BACL|nr:sugar ABC transporter substrate-binding protein [Saccharibacillus kuerlensis]GGN92740.1 sugar ABC transporter substrate-binding protein [Saccharibacillus kuerlensis]